MSDELERDPLDRLCARCRPPVPEGLADRIIAAAGDPRILRRHYWLLVAESARSALRVAAIVLAATVALACYARARSSVRPLESDRDRDAAVDQVARVTVTGSSAVLNDSADLNGLEGEGE
jgi:hypothetical protein